jgi:flagellin-like protein
MKNFRSRKAISPIFATLILIAIAVIAGVVVYMFTSGTLATMTSGGVAGTEKVTIQAFSISSTGPAVTVYVQSSTGATINSIIIKDSTGNVVGTFTGTFGGLKANVIPSDGSLQTITGGTWTASGTEKVTAGQTYTATLTTVKGGNFVSSSAVSS